MTTESRKGQMRNGDVTQRQRSQMKTACVYLSEGAQSNDDPGPENLEKCNKLQILRNKYMPIYKQCWPSAEWVSVDLHKDLKTLRASTAKLRAEQG